MPDWCVVISKSAMEEVAEARLHAQGYEVYLPRHRRILKGHRRYGRWGGRGEVVLRPLFARYLFAVPHPEKPWSVILSTRGVADLLMWDENTPALLRQGEIEGIQQREQDGLFDEARDDGIRKDLVKGEQVRTKISGVSILGIVDEDLTTNGKAIIRAMIFGRSSRIQVEAETLEKVD